MALDKDTVARVAHLARIQVDEADLEKLSGELSGILGWVEQLSEVDTEGVEPMTSVANLKLRMREDQISAGDSPDLVLKNGPSTELGFYVVPKVVE